MENHHPPKRTKTTHNESPTTSISYTNPTSIIPNLPYDLSVEILSRLPVKSLLQLKTISKLWNKLISSPNFTKTHLSSSVNSPNRAHHHLIFSTVRPCFTLRECPLPSIIHDPVPDANDIDYPMKNPHKSVWLAGSVNGLICLAIEESDVFLWNPSLRKSRKLPCLGIELKDGCYIVYGFGYDSSNDDYKVVCVLCVFRSARIYETEVKVYSMNSNSWTNIDGFEGSVPLNDSGKFANGKLHWATSPWVESSGKWNIVSLDMGSEKYGVVEQPDYGGGEFDFTLGVLDGLVCVLCNYPKTRLDIWVMKEYGVRESWTKFVSFSYIDNPEKYMFEATLCLFKNGEILLLFGSTLLIYNPDEHSQRYLEMNGFNACLEVEIFVESLVSPGDDAQ